MRVVTCHQGQLQIAASQRSTPANTGDGDGPGDPALPTLESGHVHELLSTAGTPRTVAAWLSRAALQTEAVVWCEPNNGPYPPALAAMGLSPRRVHLLRPKNDVEAVWAITEALRCRAVGVTIATVPRLTPVEARRLQLAAEHGGGLGLLIRRPDAAIHAARTRWLVRPELGSPLTQRWRLRLVHGHGRPTDQDLLLEVNRETHHVRATAVLADRPNQTASARTAG